MGNSLQLLAVTKDLEPLQTVIAALRRADFDVDYRIDDGHDGFDQFDVVPDLILAGPGLQELPWQAMLQAARARDREIPFLVLAGEGEEDMAAACLDAGADGRLLLRLPEYHAITVRHVRECWQLRREKRQLEQLLSISERRFTKLVENVSDTILLLDDQGVVQYANPSTQRMLGYHPSEMIGRNFADLYDGDRQVLLQRYHEFLQEGKDVIQFEVRLRHRDGSPRWVEGITRNLLAEPGIYAVLVNYYDISLQRESQQALLRQLDELKALHAASVAATDVAGEDQLITQVTEIFSQNFYPDHFGVLLLDEHSGRLKVHPSYRGKAGQFVRDVALGDGITGSVAQNGSPRRLADVSTDLAYLVGEPDTRSELCVPLKVGDSILGVINAESPQLNAFSEDDERLLVTLAGQLANSIAKVRLLESTHRQKNELVSLNTTAVAISSILDVDEMLACLHEQISALLRVDTFLVAVYDACTQEIQIIYAVEANQPICEWQGLRLPLDDGGLTGWVVSQQQPLLVRDMLADDTPVQPKHGVFPSRSWLGVPLIVQGNVVGAMSVQTFQPESYDQGHLSLMQSIAAQVAIALENGRLFREVHQRADELGVLEEIASELLVASTRAGMLPVLLNKLGRTIPMDGALLSIYNLTRHECVIEQAYGIWSDAAGWTTPIPFRIDDTGIAVTEGRPDIDLRSLRPDLFDQSENVLRISLGNPQSMGCLYIGRQARFSENEINLITAVTDMAASAIHRASLHETTERNMQQLTALRSIDLAITASLDVRVTCNILLEQVTSLLDVDAADILIFYPHLMMLKVTAWRGFRSNVFSNVQLRLGEGHAGRAALHGEVVAVRNLMENHDSMSRDLALAGENFVSYYGVPLMVMGKAKGVLEIFHRRPLNPNKEWFNFLETLAGQAAIAIDHAQLFNDLQRSNRELAMTYDRTLEGWVHALDLRDHETENHTQRVTEITINLAQSMGFGEDDLLQIRRGGLLHDVGKIAIPDRILLKPGPLTDDEWIIMRRHPIYAYDLLSPIEYLIPALVIPYCHHERWDGSGYPRGLKGDQIPLEARIFAVVDVWDALSNDRPYRKAWSSEDTLEYIQEQSGKQFDPMVVRTFLRFIREYPFRRTHQVN
ncbi:MAG: GAF domain-containing protein [Chloroflexi bacterium]|nr:GAF domain-containing protein [Chloroflexota bacterium]